MNVIGRLEFSTLLEAEDYASKQVCAYCLGKLRVDWDSDGKHFLTCPEHGVVTKYGTVYNYTAEQVKQERLSGQAEMRHEERKLQPTRPTREILADLGFSQEENS